MGQYYKAIFLSDNKQMKEIIRMWIEPTSYEDGNRLMEHSYIYTNTIKTVERFLSVDGTFYKSRIVWAGDYADPEIEDTNNLYELAVKNSTFYNQQLPTNTIYRYILNHTKKLYVDKTKLNNSIHPLPLLVSEGNGRGGGDYFGDNDNICGSWARDIISVENDMYDYTELVCGFSSINME